MSEKMEKRELLIVGGGPAGLTAGLYASRARVDTLLIEKLGLGGQLLLTDRVENYPGFPDGIGGFELADAFDRQARRFGLEVRMGEARSVRASPDGPVIETDSGPVRARGLIIASGSVPRKLGVPGEEELSGKGVSYCAVCDGAFYRDMPIVVVGGGDTAVEEADFLTRYASKVTLIHRRGELRATKIVQERAFANEKIDFLWNTVVERIEGEGEVGGLALRNVRTGEKFTFEAAGVFVLIGSDPQSAFIEGYCETRGPGYIDHDELYRAGPSATWVCGDVAGSSLRQVATAVGEGAVVAMNAEKYLGGLK